MQLKKLKKGEKSLLKTLWEKKKMLVTSIFFFSHNVFYPMKHNFNVLSNICLLSANAFNLGKPEILSSVVLKHFLLFPKCFQNFLSGVFSPLKSEACEKSSWWLWIEKARKRVCHRPP